MTFRSILTMACCAAALLAPASAAPRPGDAKLRDDLDVAYNTWRLHLLRGSVRVAVVQHHVPARIGKGQAQGLAQTGRSPRNQHPRGRLRWRGRDRIGE